MHKYWGAILVLVALISCKEDKVEQQEVAKVIVEEPVVKRFGFDFDNYTIVQDTVKNGDSFGQLMLKNSVDYEKVITISEKFRDTFDVRKINVGKPYFILKSKDSLEKAEVFIYQNDKINYTVFDLKDSTTVYKSKRKVNYVEREIAGVIKNSLSVDMDSLGVDYNVTLNLADVYAWTIDFFKLEKGDKFKIIYDERYINDSIYAGVTPIKAAYFEHKGKPIYAFPYVVDSLKQIEDYY